MGENTPEAAKRVVRIAVRSLVEQIYRSGSLGVDFGGTERAVEGIAGHRKIRMSRPDGYRTEEDRGVVALIDERFAGLRYQRLFPKEWRPVQVTSVSRLREILEEVWGG